MFYELIMLDVINYLILYKLIYEHVENIYYILQFNFDDYNLIATPKLILSYQKIPVKPSYIYIHSVNSGINNFMVPDAALAIYKYLATTLEYGHPEV